MRTPSFPRLLGTFLASFILVAVPASSFAAKGDCGQPVSTGTGPSTADCLVILKSAVQQATACDPKPCICDVTGDNKTTTADALRCLQKAVQQPVILNCNCPPSNLLCTSAEITSRTGSDLDSGWTGIAHNQDLILGASVFIRGKRHCTDTNADCMSDAGCSNHHCVTSCDCNQNQSCDIVGPVGNQHCFNSLATCTTNGDCPTGQPCIASFGPPLPLSSGGTPVCIVTTFDGQLTGTANAVTGEGKASANLKSRVYLGIQLDKPCPTCGTVDELPKIGDTFSCGGGVNDGSQCTVDGVSPVFGGTSFDCPPETSDNVSGSGLAIRFQEVTTGTTTKTAQLPCGNLSYKGNPLNAGSNPKCLDHNLAADPVCASNADCKRCTGDPTVSCTSNANCTGKGTCAEAPDQPITCGYWCSCGFCNGNASLPCFENGDCPSGQTCQIGPGSGTAQNSPQQKPNDCSKDKNICGMQETELCANTTIGKCSDQPYRSCTEGSTTCEDNAAGTCTISNKPCFESRITRTGSPSPLGTYCAFENKTCTSNADCTTEDGDFCAKDASRPQTVALFCVPATAQSSINTVGGITGPGAISLASFVQVCRCGDHVVGCDETCDDGNTASGDGCDDFCHTEP